MKTESNIPPRFRSRCGSEGSRRTSGATSITVRGRCLRSQITHRAGVFGIRSGESWMVPQRDRNTQGGFRWFVMPVSLSRNVGDRLFSFCAKGDSPDGLQWETDPVHRTAAGDRQSPRTAAPKERFFAGSDRPDQKYSRPLAPCPRGGGVEGAKGPTGAEDPTAHPSQAAAHPREDHTTEGDRA